MSKVNGKDKEPAKELPIIKRDRLKMREAVGNEWFVIAPAKLDPKDVTAPSIWSAVADQFNRDIGMDIVRVLFEEQRLWKELLVVQATSTRATLVELRTVSLPERFGDDDRMPANHEITYSQEDGYIVRRISDGVILGTGREKGFYKREDAVRYLLDHATLRQTTH